MPGWTEDVREAVRGLIGVCDDAENGFGRAAAMIRAADTKALLLQCAAERRQFAAVLRTEARRAGEDPETGGSGVGPSAWSGLERASPDDEHGVISIAAGSEKLALERYRSALETPNLPSDLRAIVQLQFARMCEVHDRLEALRESTAFA